MLRLFSPIKKPSHFKQLFNLAFTVILLSKILPVDGGQWCFESPGDHDYTLTCMHGGATIMQELKNLCGVYNNGLDDCANFFIITLKFCKGLLAGSICDLSFHDINLVDPCIKNVTATFCTNGFGSLDDYAIVGGITLLSAILLCGAACYCVAPRSAINANLEGQNPVAINADERTPLRRHAVVDEIAGHVSEVGADLEKAKPSTQYQDELNPFTNGPG